MNNPLNLPWQTIAADVPAESIISAAQLNAMRQQQAATTSLEEKIQQAYAQLDVDIQQRTSQAEEQIAQMKAAAEVDIAQHKAAQCDQAVREAVRWLCDEQQLEQMIARELNQRWCTYTANALESLFQQSDQTALLLQRIEQEVNDVMFNERVTLSTAAAEYPALAEAWRDVDFITVKRDPQLVPGQAILDNGLVRIHLDLPGQQSEILSQLRAVVDEKKNHGEN